MSWHRTLRSPDALLAMGVIGILLIMVLPMPPIALDLFLSVSLASSILMLLTSVYITRALEFSSFPTLLLLITLFRLSLNVATTRAILIRGPEMGPAAAGSLVEAFGEYVVGGNFAVGVIIFIILVIINFIVITKGAGRVAEVAARFTLDAMPGKQMAIDADLNAGTINEETARLRRSEVAREADFYGAMDGSSKFVRGDAIAGIMIVFVNVIGGILIGVLQKDMSLASAAQTFTLLTIGDGLIGQIPALIVSTAAGIIVTRAGGQQNLSTELGKQVFTHSKALGGSAAVMMGLGIIPGLPAFPLMTLGIGLGYLAYNSDKKTKAEAKAKRQISEDERLKPVPEKIESLLGVDPLELEVGYGLVNLVDHEQSGDLLERISGIRKQFALELGVVVPPLRIRDNLELKPGEYQVLLKGIPIGQGNLMPGQFLAMDPGNVVDRIFGVPTKEPAFGLDAVWVSPAQKEQASMAGYTVVDLSTVIATHLTELIRGNAAELMGRQELQSLLDGLKASVPKVVEDLIPTQITLGTLLKIIKNLLKEGVSIRDLRTVLEAAGEMAPYQKDANVLTEHVRSALARTISRKLISGDGKLHLITLDRRIEETLAQGILQTDQGAQLSVEPEFVRDLVAHLNEQAAVVMAASHSPIVLCSPLIRYHLKNLVDRFIPNITVISHNEIAPNVSVEAEGIVRFSNAS